ncbi:hypothetical protein EUGRSUZ_A02471 [Eucalyptus grandis]|uniref:Uncharacterized protein n=2 Tax=Eucalyptus grandis TaxID=71139 RepID=A0ACC3M7F0_EUCGR|nr:hypothetical protein EUGRSUZ_A02471 [Eucalyptus grandis]
MTTSMSERNQNDCCSHRSTSPITRINATNTCPVISLSLSLCACMLSKVKQNGIQSRQGCGFDVARNDPIAFIADLAFQGS